MADNRRMVRFNKDSQSALLWLMSNRFHGTLTDEYGNIFSHQNPNMIRIEMWSYDYDGVFDCYDIQNISYEDFVNDYSDTEFTGYNNV
jgi:hypothetical protein